MVETVVATRDKEETMVALSVEEVMIIKENREAMMLGELLLELPTISGELVQEQLRTLEMQHGELTPTLEHLLIPGVLSLATTLLNLMPGLLLTMITITKAEVGGELVACLFLAPSALSLYVILMLIAHELIVSFTCL